MGFGYLIRFFGIWILEFGTLGFGTLRVDRISVFVILEFLIFGSWTCWDSAIWVLVFGIAKSL